jgi:Uncharacterized protein conserved in bacteria
MIKKKHAGRPTQGASPKKMISMRIDPELHEALKSLGKGWQARVERLLKRKYLKEA